jgi:hypothetical protein
VEGAFVAAFVAVTIIVAAAAAAATAAAAAAVVFVVLSSLAVVCSVLPVAFSGFREPGAVSVPLDGDMVAVLGAACTSIRLSAYLAAAVATTIIVAAGAATVVAARAIVFHGGCLSNLGHVQILGEKTFVESHLWNSKN